MPHGSLGRSGRSGHRRSSADPVSQGAPTIQGGDLAGNPDFVKLAQSYGCRAFRVRRTADVRPVLEKALAYTDGPCVVDAEVVKEEDVFPMVPAGATLADMLLEPPRKARTR